MKKNRGRLVLAIIILVIVGLGYTAAFGIGNTQTGSAKNINLGLDLAGGVSITYRAVGETPTAEQMSDTIRRLQQRVETYSTESEVIKKVMIELMSRYLEFPMQTRYWKNLVNLDRYSFKIQRVMY